MIQGSRQYLLFNFILFYSIVVFLNDYLQACIIYFIVVTMVSKLYTSKKVQTNFFRLYQFQDEINCTNIKNQVES